MIADLEKEEMIKFTKWYYRSLRLKHSMIWWTLVIIVFSIILGTENLLMVLSIFLIIESIRYFFIPDLLYRETKKAVDVYYENIKNGQDNKGGSVTLICNVKKIDGPMFGIMEISKNHIKFTPFKENLDDKKFSIDINNIECNNISIVDFKWTNFNRILFKELSKGIKIPTSQATILLQVPIVEKSINLIKYGLTCE